MVCLCEECKHAEKTEDWSEIKCGNPASYRYGEVMEPGCGHCASGEMKEDVKDGCNNN